MSTSVPRELTTVRGISCVKIGPAAMCASANQDTRSEPIVSARTLMNARDLLDRYEHMLLMAMAFHIAFHFETLFRFVHRIRNAPTRPVLTDATARKDFVRDRILVHALVK